MVIILSMPSGSPLEDIAALNWPTKREEGRWSRGISPFRRLERSASSRIARNWDAISDDSETSLISMAKSVGVDEATRSVSGI